MLILIASMLIIVFGICPVKAETTTIVVPNYYLTIQEAINHANEGDTVYVKEGIYYENVLVNKSISLAGESRDTTIIDGRGYGIVIQVIEDNVAINGFTIQNSGSSLVHDPYCDAGIMIASDRNNISGNSIRNNKIGIYIYDHDYNTILNNNITNNGLGINVRGFYLTPAYNNISGNNITNNTYGIYFAYSSNNNISGNNITANQGDGMGFDHCSNNTLSGNDITANRDEGIFLSSSSNNAVSGNNLEGNDRCIWLVCCSNNSISGNNIRNNGVGVRLDYSADNSIYHNNFIHNGQQAYTDDFMNMWDDGYPSGGNYWSDYTGTDLYSGPCQNETGDDSIGDTPYSIMGGTGNTDRYPLMNPYGASPPQTYTLTITSTFGGTTDPTSGTYSYTANSIVQVTAVQNTGYVFDHWNLNNVNVGSANPYSVLMDKDYTLKAVFVPSQPVGGYSISTEGYPTAKSLTHYLALIAILTIGFTAVKRKTTRKTKVTKNQIIVS